MSGTTRTIIFTATLLAGSAFALADSSTSGAWLADRFSQSAADARKRDQQKADEQEMLARARREAESDKSLSVADPALAARKPVNIGSPAPVDDKRLEVLRQEELQRLSDKLRMASQKRVAKPVAPIETPWTTEVTAAPRGDLDRTERSALGAPLPGRDFADTRVAVLMLLTPGHPGVRRRSADPVFCVADGCYAANGADLESRLISNPGSDRASACAERVGCIFRGIDLGGASALVRPIDRRFGRYERGEAKRVAADPTCRAHAGRLSCQRPIVGETYTLWIVPETVADRVGPAALEAALADGLVVSRSAELPSAPWR
jgi:hypothetical protein